MTTAERPGPAIDAELTAYLDGELDSAARAGLERRLAADSELKAQLDLLARGGLAWRPAFDLLLAEAPTDRLAAILAGAEQAAAGPASGRPAGRPAAWRVAAAAAVLLVVGSLCGFGAARWLAPAPPVVAERPGWREVVADYVGLYTNETLALIPDDEAAIGRELADVGSRLSLALTPEAVALPDMTVKRAQLLQFRGMALGQIAYLSTTDGPVAFCIIANGRPDAPPAFEQRDGMNVVFWTKDGRGYLIIGRVPRETLERHAAALQGRVS